MIKDYSKINWNKNNNNLLPAIIQHYKSLKVLILGYFNIDSLKKTLETKKVVFYSRSKSRLWMKGESSGDFLNLIDIFLDCDYDSFLIYADPKGPTCHLKNESCFNHDSEDNINFLYKLSDIIKNYLKYPKKNSYTSNLFTKGINKIAQKIGEEGVELALASKDNDKEHILEEAADLIYHLIVMLNYKKLDLDQIVEILKSRNKSKI